MGGDFDRGEAQAFAAGVEDLFGAARADAGHADVADLKQRIKVTDPAGRFDLDVGRGV